MLRKNKIKKTLSILCAFCLIFQLLVSSIAASADEVSAQNKVVAEQDETVLNEEVQKNTGIEEETLDDKNSSAKEKSAATEKSEAKEESPERGQASENYKKTLPLKTSENVRSLNNDGAYVESLEVGGMLTGTSPFDDNDDPGNDSSPTNNIIRSFDTVTYTVHYVTNFYNQQSSYDQGYIWFRFELPCDSSIATFNTSAMGWIENGYRWDITKENINGVDTQVLTCSKILKSNGTDNDAIPGGGDVNVNINVWGAENGYKIQPTFYSWMDHNQSSSYSWFNPDGFGGHDATHQAEEVKSVQPDEVTVSAAPRFNVKLEKVSANHCSAQTTFDFSTGNDKALNKDKGQVKGLLSCYGVTLQLYGDAEKGLRGAEYPSGPITLDLDLKADCTYKDENNQNRTLSVSPLVWSAEGNSASSTQSDGRDVETYATAYAANIAPYNKDSLATDGADLGTQGSQSCFDGGEWSFSQDTSTGRVHVTVDNYKINPNWFPNVNSYQTLSNSTYYNKDSGVKSCWKACFSAGEVFVVTPLEEFINLGDKWDGKFLLSAEDKNLKAKTLSGQIQQDSADTNDQQMVKTDDETKVTIDTDQREGADTAIQYAFPGQGVNYSSDINNWSKGPFCENQKDSTALGYEAAIQTTFTGSPQGIDKNNWAAVDVLVKFDDKALKPNNKNPYLSWSGQKEGEKVTRVFAYKTDGSGWSSDEEQANAKIEDLVYYEDYSTEHGVCVGILAQLTCPNNIGFSVEDLVVKYYFNVKTEKNLVGHVAQTTVCARYATHEMLENAANRTTVTDVTNGNGNWETYCRQLPNIKGAAYSDGVSRDYYGNLVSASAKKAEYSDTGDLIYGGEGHKKYCDSLYLAAYKAKIEKDVSQRADAFDHNPRSKTLFSLDIGENIADFCLSPSVVKAKALEWTNRETIEIRDVIPNGMSYIEESAVLGGYYQPNATAGLSGTVLEGVKCHNGATVSYQVDGDEEKISVSYRIHKKDNGTTVLVWELHNVDITKPLPQIYYKAKFDDNVKNNDSFVNTAVIYGENDHRLIDETNENLTKHTVSVSITSDFSINQTVSPRVAEVNTPITYNISYNNNGPNNYSDEIMMTTLPHKEGSTGQHSSYYGDYKVSSYGFAPQSGNLATDYTVWYTTDTSAYSLTSKDVSVNEISSGTSGSVEWTAASVCATDDNGIYYLNDLPENATAIIIIGSLGSKKSVTAKVTIEPSSNHPNDVYWNNASTSNNTGTAKVDTPAYIVKRTVSGHVWYDTNRNGLQDEGEQPVTDIALRATLYRADDLSEPAAKIHAPSEKLEVDLDENGEYFFENMAEGEYIVKFTAPNGNIVSDKGLVKVTVKDADNNNNDEIDSDAIGSYNSSNDELESASTSTFNLPSLEAIIDSGNHLFEMYNVDLGLYIAKKIDITKKVNDSDHADISQRYEEVTYKINTSVPDELDITSFVVNDTLEDVLEYVKNSVKVTIGGTQLSAEQLENQFAVSSQTISFTLTSDQLQQTGDDVVITFKAKIREGADLSSYSNNGKIEIPNTANYIINNDSERTKASDAVTITPPTPPTIDIPVTKEWVGPEQDITIYLFADGVENDSVELKASTGWQHTFENKPEYDIKTGKKIEYTVEEQELANYSSDIVKNDDGSFTITNTNTETIDIPVTKEWVGPEQDSVTVYLLADGVQKESAELTSSTGWQHTFEDLLKYDSQTGKEIKYTIEELNIENYSSDIVKNDDGSFTITNTNTAKRNITVEKKWVGKELSEVTVHLFADGKEVDSAKLTKDTAWKHSFTDLAQFDQKDGHEIKYTISEDAVTGYTTSITGSAEEGFTVTNTEQEKPTEVPTQAPTEAPKVVTPKTSDNSNTVLYAWFTALSAVALALCFWHWKKSRKKTCKVRKDK